MTKHRCVECGGNVRPFAGPGRMLKHNDIPTPVPADLLVDTCARCGEMYFPARDAARIDAAMENAFRSDLTRRAREAIDKIAAAQIEQSAVEVLLCLSTGYLSKVKTGARIPAPDLVGNLALIAKAPKQRLGELSAYWNRPIEFKGKRGPKPKVAMASADRMPKSKR